MGLSWRDATALMGAHTLGRGDEDFSGHHGTWVGSNTDALVFDKAYYDEVLSNSWRPRNVDSALENWTTGDGEDRLYWLGIWLKQMSIYCLKITQGQRPSKHSRNSLAEVILMTIKFLSIMPFGSRGGRQRRLDRTIYNLSLIAVT
eukprot:scaffold12763_cov96-Skeletonema_menzelii.AAC.1